LSNLNQFQTPFKNETGDVSFSRCFIIGAAINKAGTKSFVKGESK